MFILYPRPQSGHNNKISIISLWSPGLAFLIFLPQWSLRVSEHRKQEIEAAVNYWVTHHVPEEVYSREWRWDRCPHFTLTPLTQLKREDTVTLSGVTHVVQPACISLFVWGNPVGIVRSADNKEQKEIHLIILFFCFVVNETIRQPSDTLWVKEWRQHLDSFS